MVKNKDHNKRIAPTTVALVGAVIIVIGGWLFLSNYIGNKRLLAYDYMNSQISDDEQIVDISTTNEVAINSDSTDNNTSSIKNYENYEHYIGYLTISKIGFRRGFYSVDSVLNTVASNIEVIEGSTMPDVTNGNLIIAGHSGTGWNAFFNELYRLNIDDTVEVTYNGKIYTYQIKNIYKELKTGTVSIKRDITKTTLTLITCTNNDDTTQTIYIAELVNIM